jgi:N-methylhydantoinase A
MQAYRLGVDVGGTFTDMILLDSEGGLAVRKVLSTPPNFSQGILAALDALLEERGLSAGQISEAAHGTTVATNALLTQTGARTALMTTHGFRDVLEFGRLRTPRLYDLGWERPAPLVPRELRLEVKERVLASGEVLEPLQHSSVVEAVRTLRAAKIESVAVCLLNGYKNSKHEEQIAAILAREAPDLFVSLSSTVLPEIREFERTSTTVVNAYIQPAVQRYLDTLVDGLSERGVTSPLLVMQSNGGVVSPAAAVARPIHIIESGPAAGVMGALTIASHIGLQDIICFDMGGTTAKACIIEGGRVTHARECEVGAGLNAGHRLLSGGGYLVRSPILDIAEVGAGGGSIARIAEGGVLKVGPQSASAVPGPVCYGRGGVEPTVTDANVVLGYLNPRTLAGGSIPIDVEAARRTIHDKIATPLGIDLIEAAFGIHRIANAAMVRAVRTVSVERGRDPRKFALFAFGGGGPLHGANLAQILEMTRMVVPPAPGLFSAFGLLCSPQEHHYVRTFWRKFADVNPWEVSQPLQSLMTDAYLELEGEGFPRERVSMEAAADIRYVGQNAELSIPLPNTGSGSLDLRALRDAFEAEHEVQYGYRSAQEALQFTSLRVVARAVRKSEHQWRPPNIWTGRASVPIGAPRSIYFGPAEGWAETPVIRREDLDAEFHSGPLAIEEYDSTTIVQHRCRVRKDEWENIVMELPGK